MSKNILGIFDGYDIEGIKALVESLEQSSFDYMKLEGGGVAITIGKNGAGEAPVVMAAPAAAPLAEPAAVSVTVPAAAPVATQSDSAPEAKPETADQTGVTVIRSPSYGLFYAQSEPGAPPYVKLGDRVKTGDTVGLLEIMKTFNAVTSPVDGEVAEIHVSDGETLEPEQPLFSIRV